MIKRILLTVQVMILLAVCGCVGVNHKSRPRSWPKPTQAINTKEFDGLFSNRRIDPETGLPSDGGTQLFDFLRGRGNTHGNRGTQVEIHASLDESVLHVRLLDEHGLEIDSVRLQRDADYELSQGFLDLHGPSSGTLAHNTNLGAEISRESSQLYISSSGDLLGRRSDSGAGLLGYFFPVVSSFKDWVLWPKIIPK